MLYLEFRHVCLCLPWKCVNAHCFRVLRCCCCIWCTVLSLRSQSTDIFRYAVKKNVFLSYYAMQMRCWFWFFWHAPDTTHTPPPCWVFLRFSTQKFYIVGASIYWYIAVMAGKCYYSMFHSTHIHLLYIDIHFVFVRACAPHFLFA